MQAQAPPQQAAGTRAATVGAGAGAAATSGGSPAGASLTSGAGAGARAGGMEVQPVLRNLQQSSGAMHPGLPDVPVQQEPWPCSTELTHVVYLVDPLCHARLAQLMCDRALQ